jgi:hypothetical protein
MFGTASFSPPLASFLFPLFSSSCGCGPGKGKTPMRLGLRGGPIPGVVGFGQGDKGVDTTRALVGWSGESSDVAAR